MKGKRKSSVDIPIQPPRKSPRGHRPKSVNDIFELQNENSEVNVTTDSLEDFKQNDDAIANVPDVVDLTTEQNSKKTKRKGDRRKSGKSTGKTKPAAAKKTAKKPATKKPKPEESKPEEFKPEESKLEENMPEESMLEENKDHFVRRSSRVHKPIQKIIEVQESDPEEELVDLDDLGFDDSVEDFRGFDVPMAIKPGKNKKLRRKLATKKSTAKNGEHAGTSGSSRVRSTSARFFNDGDLVWFACKKRPTSFPVGIKKILKDLETEVTSGENIYLDIRVAMEETRHMASMKKYETLCKKVGKNTGKNDKPQFIGHEFLFEWKSYGDSNDIKLIKEFIEKHNMEQDYKSQEDFIQSVEEKFWDDRKAYFKGEKALPDPELIEIDDSMQENEDNDADASVVEIVENGTGSPEPEADENQDKKSKVKTAEEIVEMYKKKKDKYKLQASEIEEFIQKDPEFRKHIERYKCKRHEIIMNDTRTDPFSKIVQLDNLSFLRHENMSDAKILLAALDLVKTLPYFKDKSEALRTNYAKYVIIPESIEFRLRKRCKFTVQEAHILFLNHKEEQIDDDFDNVQQVTHHIVEEDHGQDGSVDAIPDF